MEEFKALNQISFSQFLKQIEALASSAGFSELMTKNYTNWILRFVRFHNQCRLADMGKTEIETFLSFLADELNHDQLAQETALKALEFLYSKFLKVKFGNLHYSRLKKRRGFFSRFDEHHCHAVINKMNGATQLMTKLALLTNLTLREVINLKLSDIDLKKNQLIVRDYIGTHGDSLRIRKTEISKTPIKDSLLNKKFTVNIPVQLILDLRIQIMKVHHLIRKEKERQVDQALTNFSIFDKHLEPKQQYLFPHNFQRKNDQTSSLLDQMPLAILKSDIRLAIRTYRRFLPNDNYLSSNIKIPKQSQSQVTPATQAMQVHTLLIKQSGPQTSFNF
ncbi:phage integrase N-terminal SAM-like domain-containing protein [Aliikangiella coralliicola]|uniref:Integrase SAM-like N-terminal domain-containing protein n=1 Tax=Aliikangiella coralliicola TaxID=2592383 RepID=A0A545UHQ8_9GAMM|nr:phage integrase N-terminal SAM-like domain-containing protein [Aliikangiella coralliicola]TQV89000.1 hypothetical protein FLL46_05580 [Aliikangiella coralliicola]